MTSIHITTETREAAYQMLRSRTGLGMIDASCVSTHTSDLLESGLENAALQYASSMVGVQVACKLIALLSEA